MNLIKKQGVWGWVVFAAVILTLVSMIVYIVNSTTGYLDGTEMNAAPIVLTIVFIVGALVLLAVSDRLDERITGAVLFVLALLVAGATLVFIVERVEVISDMLNPVNHPDAQIKTVRAAIAGISVYLVAFLAMAAAAMGGRLTRKEE